MYKDMSLTTGQSSGRGSSGVQGRAAPILSLTCRLSLTVRARRGARASGRRPCPRRSSSTPWHSDWHYYDATVRHSESDSD